MYDIIAILIPIVLAICIVLVVRTVSDAGVKKRLAETQTDPEVFRIALESHRKYREQTLTTWGITALSTGTAATLVGVIGIGAQDPHAYGLLFMGCGIGLLASVIVGRLMKS